MFSAVTDNIKQFIKDFKGLAVFLLVAMALIFLVPTAITSMNSFRGGDTKKGFIFLGLGVMIIVVALIIFGAINGIGKGLGEDINSTFGGNAPATPDL